MSLQAFKDAMANAAHGMTKAEAHNKGVCISCKLNIDELMITESDETEYEISGLCPTCFNRDTELL